MPRDPRSRPPRPSSRRTDLKKPGCAYRTPGTTRRQPQRGNGVTKASSSATVEATFRNRHLQLLDIGFVEIHLRYGGGDLGERQDAHLLALEDQSLDFFEFLQIHN